MTGAHDIFIPIVFVETDSTVIELFFYAKVLIQPLLLSFLFAVLVCMKDLKSFSLETYEKVWKRLDKKLENTKKGNYKDVASEFKFEEEDIWEFEKELHSFRSGSPSEKLLESLEAKRPNLTVLEFIKVLQKSTIQRKDIIELLESHIYRHCETS